MKRLTDDELRLLAADLESPRVERKAKIEKGATKEKACRSLCAFANDLVNTEAPGVLFVGLDDDGRPTGLTVDSGLLAQLDELVRDPKLTPKPNHEVRVVAGEEADFAAVVVYPFQSPPVRFAGDIWVRTSSSVHRASLAEELILTERRQHRDVRFGQRSAPSATLADLDLDLFRDLYWPAIVSEATLRENHRSDFEKLRVQGLADRDQVPTFVGLILLGVQPTQWVPGAYVDLTRIQGREIGDPVASRKLVAEPMIRAVDNVLQVLSTWTTSSLSMNGMKHETRIDYPLVALREFVVNALVHRTYEATSAPVHVRWFDDRIEILSPGGPYGQVTPENLGQPGVADYRNPRLAEAMLRLGYMEKAGSGIPKARRALAGNGNPDAKLLGTQQNVKVVLFPATSP